MALPKVLVEPGHRAFHEIPLVFGLADAVAFLGVDDEFGRDSKRLEGVPEFERLGRRAFPSRSPTRISVGVFGLA